jgi:hypothetical protein
MADKKQPPSPVILFDPKKATDQDLQNIVDRLKKDAAKK